MSDKYVHIANSGANIKKMLDRGGVVDELAEQGGSGSSPDWLQNNESAPDHVKNRTHYDNTILIGEATSEDNQMPLSETIDANNSYLLEVDGKIKKVEIELGYEENSFSIIDASTYEEYLFGDFNLVILKVSVPHDYKIYRVEVVPLPDKYIPDSIARKKDIKWDNLEGKPFYIDNKATFSTDGDKIIATFEKPLNAGEQLWYSYNVPGVGTVKASSKGIAVWSSDTSKYRVSIGNKEMTDYGMMGYSTIGTNIMEISYASTNNFQTQGVHSYLLKHN